MKKVSELLKEMFGYLPEESPEDIMPENSHEEIINDINNKQNEKRHL